MKQKDVDFIGFKCDSEFKASIYKLAQEKHQDVSNFLRGICADLVRDFEEREKREKTLYGSSKTAAHKKKSQKAFST